MAQKKAARKTVKKAVKKPLKTKKATAKVSTATKGKIGRPKGSKLMGVATLIRTSEERANKLANETVKVLMKSAAEKMFVETDIMLGNFGVGTSPHLIHKIVAKLRTLGFSVGYNTSTSGYSGHVIGMSIGHINVVSAGRLTEEPEAELWGPVKEKPPTFQETMEVPEETVCGDSVSDDYVTSAYDTESYTAAEATVDKSEGVKEESDELVGAASA